MIIKSLTFFQNEKFENDVDGYANENRLLHQATQKLEKQLVHAHAHNESLQKTFQQNELSYQEKVNKSMMNIGNTKNEL
jgi:hypothetical protein